MQAQSQGRLPTGFLKKSNQLIPTNLAFLPFGGGASLCPGRRFARNEIKTLFVMLHERYVRITTTYDVISCDLI
jgi:cytochrome P450